MLRVAPSDLDQIESIPISYLGRHPGHCCEDSRRLLVGRLLAEGEIGSALATIPQLVVWGPTAWPAYWCDFQLGKGELRGDCGVHAVLASEVLNHLGVPYRRGRAAIVPDPGVADHWRARWVHANVPEPWITQTAVHHEVLAVADGWWDPTEARWFRGAAARLLAGWVAAVREEGGAWMLEPKMTCHA